MSKLTQSQIEQFKDEGYLVAKGILDFDKDIQPLIDEYSVLLDELAKRWYAEGKLTSTYSDLAFGERLIRVIAESGQAYYQHMDISLPQAGVMEDTPMHLGSAVFDLLRSPRLLDAVESIIGSEIYSNPVQHVRIKPPDRAIPENLERNSLTEITPWHQDQGVIEEDADESEILTVWLPITEASVEHGCLTVVPNSHKGDLQLHCPTTKGLAIPTRIVGNDTIALPMSPGDVLFMNSKLMHASLPNMTDEIRWSFDLRYNPIGHHTGRHWFPGFIARSKSNPDSELTDADEWAKLWQDARADLAVAGNQAFNRWDADAEGCA